MNSFDGSDHNCTDGNIDDDFNMVFNKDVHRYNTGHKNNTRKPRANRRWDHWTVFCHAADYWNIIDPSIRLITAVNKFKSALYKMNF